MFKPLWTAGTLVAALVLANPIAAQQGAPASSSA
jgi:hypothetical protein